MSKISDDTIVSRHPDFIATDMDGDTVMMRLEQEDYYGISGAGSYIWDLLDKPIKLSDIVEKVCEEFEVDEPTCRADAIEFIEALLQMDLASIS